MTSNEVLQFVAGPFGIVIGLCLIVFRKSWSAAARGARRAKGDPERVVNSQTPRLYVVLGVFAIIWGAALLSGLTAPHS